MGINEADLEDELEINDAGSFKDGLGDKKSSQLPSAKPTGMQKSKSVFPSAVPAKKEENKQVPAPPVSEPPKQVEKKQVSFGNLGKKEEPAKPAEQKPGLFGAGLNKAADQSQP